jgi:stage II sporulation protein D
MRDRLPTPLLGLLTALLLATVLARPAAAQDPDAPVDLGAYGAAVRFESGAGGVIAVEGDRRYADTIEIRTSRRGELVLINELSTQAYVEGLAEVPARWPMEALKAQAVAARTYAWYQARLGTFDRRGLGYDICATVACQVFHGREVVETPGVGQRWADAVAATDGEVLLFEDEPILARFFSTSGGHTMSNEEVFTNEGPRPYLKGVPDPYDEVSPLHRWQARFTREQLDMILAQGETLAAATPFADLTVREVPRAEDRLVVTGRDGTTAEVRVSEFRFFVSSVAPDLYPDRFPGSRSDGGQLPATLPSSRFDITIGENGVVFEGRGWGHGVGLSQYGALGQAEAGIAYADILASYYQGLRPATPGGLPERLRVGLDNDVTESIVLRSDRPFRVVASGEVITERGLGTWRMAPRADGSMGLLAPPGYGAPLIVAPTATTRVRPTTVEVVTLETVVNKPSELQLEVTDADGGSVLSRSLGIVGPGKQEVSWDLDDADGSPVSAGEYRARLVATDEDAVSAGEPATVTVTVPEIPADPPASVLSAAPPEEQGAFPAGALAVAGLLGLAVGGGLAAAVRVRA